MPATKKTGENKTKPEAVKPVKELSPKAQIEADHLAGEHKVEDGDKPNCGLCERRTQRHLKKVDATKRFFAAQKA